MNTLPAAYILSYRGSKFDAESLSKRLALNARPFIVWNRISSNNHKMSLTDLAFYPLGILRVEYSRVKRMKGLGKRLLRFSLSSASALVSILSLLFPSHRGRFRYECARANAVKFGHLQAWDLFLEGGEGWALFLEDDAQVNGSIDNDFGEIEEVFFTSKFAMIEFSESYSLNELGVQSHEFLETRLMPSGSELFQLAHAYSNTTCATAYSRDLVSSLRLWILEASESRILKNVPIDWLIDFFYCQNLDEVECFHYVPGLFSQGSPFRERYRKLASS